MCVRARARAGVCARAFFLTFILQVIDPLIQSKMKTHIVKKAICAFFSVSWLIAVDRYKCMQRMLAKKRELDVSSCTVARDSSSKRFCVEAVDAGMDGAAGAAAGAGMGGGEGAGDNAGAAGGAGMGDGGR